MSDDRFDPFIRRGGDDDGRIGAHIKRDGDNDDDDSVESRIRQQVGDDVDIHDTKDPEEIYLTNPSKMKLVLQDFERAVRAKSGIMNPIVLGITTLSVLFVSDFNSMFGLSAELWRSIFLLTTVGCGIWLMISAYKVYKYRGKTDPEYVVEELKSSK